MGYGVTFHGLCGILPRVGTTGFIKHSADWNAEPNAPNPEVTVVGENLVLQFAPNQFLYPRFSTLPRVRLV